MADRERLEIGNRGWVRYRSSALPAAVLVRYEDSGGQLQPVDVFIEALAGQSLSTDVLRDVRLGGLDAWVNSAETAVQVRYRMGVAGPDLRRPARTFSRVLGPTSSGEPLRRHWVDDMYWAQHPGSGVPQAPLKALRPISEVPDEELDAERARAYELAGLDVPVARPFGDDFYRSVAAAYSALGRWTPKPAAEMADRNGVMVSRVHKWIKESRRRGFLGAGRRGKVG